MSAPYPPLDGSQPCASVGDEMFFPGVGDNGRSIDQAIDVCRACEFLGDCLAYALTHQVDGIWGGTTVLTRRRLRREYGITAQVVGGPDVTGLHDNNAQWQHPLRGGLNVTGDDERESA